MDNQNTAGQDESQEKIDSDHIIIKQLEKEIRELLEETERRRNLYEIANEHRIAMADEINELNKYNLQLRYLLRRVFDALPSKNDIGTDLYNEIESVLTK